MSTIAIVDDRKEDREVAQRRIQRGLKNIGASDDWRVVSTEPLAQISDYVSWLTEEDVAVLILDQRLNEAGANRVDYTGHDIVTRITPRMFDLPVYYLTSIKDVTEIEEDKSRVRAILQRDEFVNSDPTSWVAEFVRQGNRYEEDVARKLARLSELSEAAANGELSPDEATEAASLRQDLHLVFESGDPTVDTGVSKRSELLDDFASELSNFEQALAQLRKTLESATGESTDK